jgi:phosphatidylinositol alpha-mannosyltransferase
LLVPRGDPTALAETLRDLALSPQRTVAMGRVAAETAERYAWPQVAGRIMGAYEDALAIEQPVGALQRAAVQVGAIPADLGPRRPPRRLPTLDPSPQTASGRTGRLGRVARRAGFTAAGVAAAGGAYLALDHIGLRPIGNALIHSSPAWVLLGLGLMCLSMCFRAISWHATLKAALPEARPRWRDAFQGISIGVLMSATLPARLGEPARALIVARRLGRPRERLPVVLGTLVSQTLMNLLALVILGAVMFATVGLFAGRQQALLWYALAPFAALCAVLVAPALLRSGLPSRSARVARAIAKSRASLGRVRSGLVVFRKPRLGVAAVSMQLFAWALQWMSCYVLLVALGLEHRAGVGAAAGVLFAVNVTAVLPVTPSNLGVFQAACVAVLTGAYGVGAADALGYGIILQCVEIATAVVMGAPALVKEGVSWREVRLRALHATPVQLSPLPKRRAEFEA